MLPGGQVASVAMNDTHGATLTARPGPRARYPWLVPGILVAVLVLLTAGAMVGGLLTSLDLSFGHDF